MLFPPPSSSFILPTPPRSARRKPYADVLPTPEDAHTRRKTNGSQSSSVAFTPEQERRAVSGIPTPQSTVRKVRKDRTQMHMIAEEDMEVDVELQNSEEDRSPMDENVDEVTGIARSNNIASGGWTWSAPSNSNSDHGSGAATTIPLSGGHSSHRSARPDVIAGDSAVRNRRRRPGLTFAQQMGLLGSSSSSSSSSAFAPAKQTSLLLNGADIGDGVHMHPVQARERMPSQTSSEQGSQEPVSEWTSVFHNPGPSNSQGLAHKVGTGMAGHKLRHRTSSGHSRSVSAIPFNAPLGLSSPPCASPRTNRETTGESSSTSVLLGAAPILDASQHNPFLVSSTSSHQSQETRSASPKQHHDTRHSPPLIKTPELPTRRTAFCEGSPDAALNLTSTSSSEPPLLPNLAGTNQRKWTPPTVGVEDDNPFLVSFSKQGDELKKMQERRQNAKLNGEKPTIDYVFRGTKTTFANPYYKRDGTPAASNLPVIHPNFSPAPVPKPRLLFPPRTGSSVDAEDDSMADSGDEDAELDLSSSRKLLFGVEQGCGLLGKRTRSSFSAEQDDSPFLETETGPGGGRKARPNAAGLKTALHRL